MEISPNRQVLETAYPSTYEAQAILPQDIADIEAVTILDEVLGLAHPKLCLQVS